MHSQTAVQVRERNPHLEQRAQVFCVDWHRDQRIHVLLNNCAVVQFDVRRHRVQVGEKGVVRGQRTLGQEGVVDADVRDDQVRQRDGQPLLVGYQEQQLPIQVGLRRRQHLVDMLLGAI